MKDYQDLVIRPSRDPAEVIAAIDAHLADGWSRDNDAEKYARHLSSSAIVFNYRCTKLNTREAAMLAMIPRDCALHVINITPAETGHLSHEQYNAILGDFYTRVVQPVEASGVCTVLFSDEVDLEAELGADIYGRLELFSNAANKSTGSSHPMDRERWFDFLCAIFRSDAELDTTTLGRWLRETQEWPDEGAHELSIEYEFAMGLLTHYAKTLARDRQA